MTNPFEFPEMVSFFLSADWSKNVAKRSVYLADVHERSIKECDCPQGGWSLETLLEKVEILSQDGMVLVGVDVVLGVPKGYWQLIRRQWRRNAPVSFVDWLSGVGDSPDFFEEVKNPDDWHVNRPWFKVSPVKGGLTAFKNKVEGGMLRRIDRETNANPVFAVSGIPGVVGGATREFWNELSMRLSQNRSFAIWPFDGQEPGELVNKRIIALCETYPALAYAAALADELPTRRIRNAKSNPEWRNKACDSLERAAWVRKHDVKLGDLDPPRKNEDDFDAHFTAAAVLRCILEGRKLTDDNWIDSKAEGSMLLAGPVKPDRTSKGP